MESPGKLAHYGLQTNDIPGMRDWYLTVLGGEVVHEDPQFCFMSYDDEHHRLVLINLWPMAPVDQHARGLNHVAFGYRGLAALLETYERLKARNITPDWCVNHGPNTSIYYLDPDGNRVELTVENFATMSEAKDYMRRSGQGAPMTIDPDEMLRELRAGVPERELLDPARPGRSPAGPPASLRRGR
jgi:catechol-2,3-dioxygenase